MIKLIIKGWSDESAWLSSDNWSHLDYCQRLYHCTCLRGMALDLAAESLLNRESCTLELVSRERAEALIFILASCGAQFDLKFLRPQKVISLELYRRRAEIKTVTQAIADAR
ncbi:MAG: hypothetical protein ABW152_18355 [Candidatus Thiodiazotropha endolucinida]